MKNFFAKNKALLVILLAILIGVGNYLVYPVFIKNNMNMINVPIARTSLAEGQMITSEDVQTISIAKDMLPHGIYISADAVVGKYVLNNYTVPSNGFFYSEMIGSEEMAYGSVFSALSPNKVAYPIVVSNDYNPDHQFKEGMLVNIYFVPTKKNTSLYYGILGEKVRVISVNEKESSTYLTLEINEDETKYYTLAQMLGNLVPLITYDSNGINNEMKSVYSTEMLHQVLAEYSMDLKEGLMTDEAGQ